MKQASREAATRPPSVASSHTSYPAVFSASGEVPGLSCDPAGVSLVKHRSCS